MDKDRSAKLSVKEFMQFMRLHGRSLDKISKQHRVVEERVALPQIERTREQLQTAVRLLENALLAYWGKHGVHIDTNERTWPKFFKEADKDGSTRLSFEELWNESQRLRRHNCAENELIKGVSRDDLIALYNVADANQSQEVTAKEWAVCLYRIELEQWPDYDPESLRRVVDTINEAAQRWHRAGGNWYKVFRKVTPMIPGKWVSRSSRPCATGHYLAWPLLRSVLKRWI